jgi:Trk-type K+ transport system membrane component
MRMCRWLGAFNAVSAFNNSGMSLLDANMVFLPLSFPEAS